MQNLNFNEQELILINKVLYRYKFEQLNIDSEYFEVIGSPSYSEIQKRIQYALNEKFKSRSVNQLGDVNILQYPDAIKTLKKLLLFLNFNSYEETRKIETLRRLMSPFKDDDAAIQEFMKFLEKDAEFNG